MGTCRVISGWWLALRLGQFNHMCLYLLDMFPSELVASTSSLSCLLTQSLVCGFARGPKCLSFRTNATNDFRPTKSSPPAIWCWAGPPTPPWLWTISPNPHHSSHLKSVVGERDMKSKIREVNQKSDTQLCLPIAHDFHQSIVRNASTSHNSPLPSGKSSSTASCKSDTLMPPAKLDSCLRILESDSTTLILFIQPFFQRKCWYFWATQPFFITGCVWRCHQLCALVTSTSETGRNTSEKKMVDTAVKVHDQTTPVQGFNLLNF